MIVLPVLRGENISSKSMRNFWSVIKEEINKILFVWYDLLQFLVISKDRSLYLEIGSKFFLDIEKNARK